MPPPKAPSGRGRTTPRRDAARSRRAIIEAAERLIRERGGAVPLYEIGRAADVGQATLYRHFPDRPALLAAVLERTMDELEAVAVAHADDPDGVVVLLREVCGRQAGSAALLELVHDTGPLSPQVQVLSDRLSRMVQAPLRTAVRHGRVRPDFTADDFVLVLGMVYGALRRGPMPDVEREALAERTLDLVLAGVLRPTPAPPMARRPPTTAVRR